MQAKPRNLSSTANSQPDEALLEAFKASGDLEQLAALYKRYMGLVYSVCLKYFKNQPASEDAVMDIFEQLVEKVKKHEIMHFRPWLGTVARNHCLMQLRKKSLNQPVSFEESFMQSGEEMHPTENGFWEDLTEGSEATQKELTLSNMERCLEKLVQQQKTCISLFYLEQKCYQEVADITGFAMDKVRSYIQNGRRNLKICMEKQLSE